jgi:hypothetical protein
VSRYEDRDLRVPKRPPRETKRSEARVKNALRHCDVHTYDDLEDEDVLEILGLPEGEYDEEVDSD